MQSASLKCEICQKPALGVYSSALGAVSIAICKRCVDMNAEPVYMFETTAWTCGDKVRPDIRDMNTFIDGNYISWNDWFEKHGQEAADRLSKSYDDYQKQQQQQPPICEDCGKYPSDPPSKLCPGCEAYKDHTS